MKSISQLDTCSWHTCSKQLTIAVKYVLASHLDLNYTGVSHDLSTIGSSYMYHHHSCDIHQTSTLYWTFQVTQTWSPPNQALPFQISTLFHFHILLSWVTIGNGKFLWQNFAFDLDTNKRKQKSYENKTLCTWACMYLVAGILIKLINVMLSEMGNQF